ncbi:MAG: DUF3987 domain-containing protein [Proteobacteria bacterium]|nr:DUF3987 domain-containing protein [Pseudomonadota bacterium]
MTNLAIKDVEAKQFTTDEAWPKPDLSLLSVGGDTPALPLKLFGEWGDWIKESAEACAAPLDYVAISLLVTAGSLIGNARWVSPWKGWKEPPVLWGALVGSPSSGKSPALNVCLEILKNIESDLLPEFEQEVREYETNKEFARAVKEDWQGKIKKAAQGKTKPPAMPADAEEPEPPIRPRLMIADATGEATVKILQAHPKGILNYRDELAGWLEKMDAYTAGNRPLWIEAFGGRPYIVDRAGTAKPIRVDRLSINVIGGIQPDRLAGLLLKGDNDGLAARFLFIWPESIPFKRPNIVHENNWAEAAMKKLSRLRLAQSENGEKPQIIFFDTIAAKTFEEWARENQKDCDSAYGVYQGFLGKLRGIAARLSLILEYLKWVAGNDPIPPKTISGETVGDVLDFINDYLMPMAQKVFAEAALPIEQYRATALAKYIFKNNVKFFNAREWMRERVCGLSTKDRIYPPLKLLEEAGWIVRDGARKGPTTGCMTSDYRVNPRIHSTNG